MSGLCGWLAHGGSVTENLHLAQQMAAPLGRFDSSGVHASAGGKSAVAVAARDGSAHIYQKEGLLASVWGRARFVEPRLAELAHAEGIAKTLADNWRERGEQTFASLTGSFCCCILDENTNEAALAIDRMGTYPLSYQIAAGGLVFGSSADAINLHPLIKTEIAPQSLYNYVYFHMVPGPDTIYQGQKRLLPGECLVYRKGRVEVSQYWQMRFLEDEKRPFQELKQDFLDVLHAGVREVVGDQEVGAFLSGGTDSSTIAGLLGEVTGKPARTYSIGFDASGYDEMEYARIAARHFATRHQEYYVTPDDIVTAIPQVAAIFDQPFGNSSAIPAYYCASMAKADGLSMMLGGDGGDELFGGNVRYAKQHLFSLYEQVPTLLRKGIIEPLVFGFPGGAVLPPIRKARSYVEQASIPMPARTETYNLLERYGHREVFTPEFLDMVNPGYPADLLSETYHQGNARSLINRMLAFDRKFTLADNDLPKVAKACELAGMDVAFPLISDEIVAFSLRLEPHLKLKGTKLRYFFKEALRGFLPDDIIAKQKHGFGLPFGVWLQTHKPLQTLAADSLSDLKSRNIVRSNFIDKLLDQHLDEHAGYHGTMVWVLMMLEQWYKQR
ncbi:asparagine synthase (glutamine-hydrolysing) [Nitrosospira briensis]|uniref:asparagine synthase (glutamine-hydrolyzing) n=1 Tax=Nitrosospira briensis TaxID=35799 RepID=A0A1I5ERD7_9PROT|nr:asparagine synthase-related protein [Nitrosospira briensis]SFO13923.1 asparagine synthase (glutamine-hydrolysing) [Nitrosospira briensis]